MVAEAPSGKAPLPAMLTSLRLSGDKQEKVEIIDQLLLPHEVRWIPVESPDEAYDAIKQMKIRGAPAIASLAALSLRSYLFSPAAASLSTASAAQVKEHIFPILDHLQSSRPTAVNLSEAMNRIRRLLASDTSASASTEASAGEVVKSVQEVCLAVHEEDLERNKTMGRLGAEWFVANRPKHRTGGLRVLTVCNTGSLATSGYGTALGVITALYEMGQLERAYYAQTTPYHQGSRLTSLELTTLKIPACMICDTMIGSLMQLHDIDGIVVGADRIVANGDTANKIGTYQAAVLAQRHGVPFMVAAPVTTVDLSLHTGKEIHIEQRPAIEATLVRGRNIDSGDLSVVRITPEGVGADNEPWNGVYNPSFDVTPADLISCVVTEKGVAAREASATSIDVSSVC